MGEWFSQISGHGSCAREIGLGCGKHFSTEISVWSEEVEILVVGRTFTAKIYILPYS